MFISHEQVPRKKKGVGVGDAERKTDREVKRERGRDNFKKQQPFLP